MHFAGSSSTLADDAAAAAIGASDATRLRQSAGESGISHEKWIEEIVRNWRSGDDSFNERQIDEAIAELHDDSIEQRVRFIFTIVHQWALVRRPDKIVLVKLRINYLRH